MGNHSCELMVMSVPPPFWVGIVSSALGRS